MPPANVPRRLAAISPRWLFDPVHPPLRPPLTIRANLSESRLLHRRHIRKRAISMTCAIAAGSAFWQPPPHPTLSPHRGEREFPQPLALSPRRGESAGAVRRRG